MQTKPKRRVDNQSEGPTDEQRAAGYTVLVGEARDERDKRVVSQLRTPESYSLAGMTSLKIVRRVFAGEAKAGFQTPSKVFGLDFITEFEKCTRTDVR